VRTRTRGALGGGGGSPGVRSRDIRIFLSTATLIIVPGAALIEHWVGQIGMHVNRDTTSNSHADGNGAYDGTGWSRNKGNHVDGDSSRRTSGLFGSRAPSDGRSHPPLRVLAVGGMSEKEAAALGGCGDPPVRVGFRIQGLEFRIYGLGFRV
jgi:hypothetical protein